MKAIFYLQRSGCQWEMLPHDFPPHQTGYSYFRKWQRKGIWLWNHDQWRDRLREQMRREKGISGGDRRRPIGEDHGKKGAVKGYDGGKKIKGRFRHIVVDYQGLVIGMLVSQANSSERLGAMVVLHEAKESLPD